MSDFKAIMHQIQFRLWLRSRPRWGAYSAPRDPLAGFKGPTSEGREGKGRGGERGGDVKGPGKWSAPGPALALGGPGFISASFNFTAYQLCMQLRP